MSNLHKGWKRCKDKEWGAYFCRNTTVQIVLIMIVEMKWREIEAPQHFPGIIECLSEFADEGHPH